MATTSSIRASTRLSRKGSVSNEVGTVDAALCYADRGWPVVPMHWIGHDGSCSCKKGRECRSPGKHPRTEHGYGSATTDTGSVRVWFRQMPLANVGISTGAESRIVVLDVDTRHNGEASLAELEKIHGVLAPTVTARSGGGGWHYYFAHPGGKVPSVNGFAEGLDLKADGNQGVVAPPSGHLSGGVYGWADGYSPQEIDLAPCPTWLLELAKTHKREQSNRARAIVETGGDGSIPVGQRYDRCVDMAVELRRQGHSEEQIANQLVGVITRHSTWDDSFTIEAAEEIAHGLAAKIEPVPAPPEPPPERNQVFDSSEATAPLPDGLRRALLALVTSSLTSDAVRTRLYAVCVGEDIAPLDPEDGEGDGGSTYRQIGRILHLSEQRARAAVASQARSDTEPNSPIRIERRLNAGAPMPPAKHYTDSSGVYHDRFPLHVVHLEGPPLSALRYVPKCCETPRTWGGARPGAGRKPGVSACPAHPRAAIVERTTMSRTVETYCSVDGDQVGEPVTTTVSVRSRKRRPIQDDRVVRNCFHLASGAITGRRRAYRNQEVEFRRRREAQAVLRVPELFPREYRERPRLHCVSCGAEEWTQRRTGEWECQCCGSPPGAGSDWTAALS
jgi:Bifunctional DNA primase/polymerase, N-terminal